MTFLYIVSKYITFPGAYVRCMWEQIICRITKTAVEDNRYIRDDEMSSHIDHELVESPSGAFAIGFVPLFFNSIGALLLATFPFFFKPTGTVGVISSALCMWFALSLTSNLFPSVEDALNMLEKTYKKGNILQKIIYTPGLLIMMAGAYLERYSITFILGVIFVFTQYVM